MAIFRVERTRDYTVMSNCHLRDRRLSLKAKGLLSQMLSLPEDWDYTLTGLSAINRESKDAVRSAVHELECAGYIRRRQTTDAGGKFSGNEYVIYERPLELEKKDLGQGDPQPGELPPENTEDCSMPLENPPLGSFPSGNPLSGNPLSENPTTVKPSLENPLSENPTTENPTTEKPSSENPTQLNKDIQSIDIQNTDIQNTDGIPIPSILSADPFLPAGINTAAGPPDGRRRDGKGMGCASAEEVRAYREQIRGNISYSTLLADCPHDRELIDEIVELMVEVVAARRERMRIAGGDFPQELVRSRFLELGMMHIQYVVTCLKGNTTKVKNIKQYLLAVLFNAPATIRNYYSSLVNHDIHA